MTHRARPFVRLQKNPSSIRYAAAAIVSTIVTLVFAGALLMRLFADDEYPTYGDALWFTLQTVTTVGYGDNTPSSAVGRVVGAVVMLVSIGLVTIATAVVTSMFIGSLSQQRQQADRGELAASLARLETALAATQERLDEIAASVATQSGDAP